MPIDRGMRQPALGARHQPPGHLRAELPRELADHRRRRGGGAGDGHGSVSSPAANSSAAGVIAHRRQQRARLDLARRHQLFDLEQPHVGGIGRAAACGDV